MPKQVLEIDIQTGDCFEFWLSATDEIWQLKTNCLCVYSANFFTGNQSGNRILCSVKPFGKVIYFGIWISMGSPENTKMEYIG